MFFYQLLVFSKEISENNRARLRGKCCNAYQRELFYSAYSTFTGTWNKKSKNMIIILARSIYPSLYDILYFLFSPKKMTHFLIWQMFNDIINILPMPNHRYLAKSPQKCILLFKNPLLSRVVLENCKVF